MSKRITKQCVFFKGLTKKALVARFDQEQASSDGGAVLLKVCDEPVGLSAAITACLRDARQQAKVEHSYQENFQQRMFGIACGYADGNDAARIADDLVFKLLAGRDPISGSALASQPMLSRFENAVSSGELLRMSEALAESVIKRHRRRKHKVRHITIDLDPTHDATHGGQQLSFFNWHYDSWCYLPLAAFLSFDNEPDQYLFCCVLRAGNAHLMTVELATTLCDHAVANFAINRHAIETLANGQFPMKNPHYDLEIGALDLRSSNTDFAPSDSTM